jgi:hypothetical protein
MKLTYKMAYTLNLVKGLIQEFYISFTYKMICFRNLHHFPEKMICFRTYKILKLRSLNHVIRHFSNSRGSKQLVQTARDLIC